MIPAANPVSVPARTLDRYWIESFRVERDSEGKIISIIYTVCLGDAEGFVVTTSNRLTPRNIQDANGAFAGDDITLGNIDMLLAAIEAIVQADLQSQNSIVIDNGKITPAVVVNPSTVLVNASPAQQAEPN